ncbi:hypothetical protein KI387_008624, partial [Taxus chinensis]
AVLCYQLVREYIGLKTLPFVFDMFDCSAIKSTENITSASPGGVQCLFLFFMR